MTKTHYAANPTLPKGRYRIVPTSLHLVVEDTAAYLTFQVSGHNRAYFSLPMEGIAQITQAQVSAAQARAKVGTYLSLAYVMDESLNEWMGFVEDNASGPSVWLASYWDRALDDIDRDAVSGGYEAWLETLS